MRLVRQLEALETALQSLRESVGEDGSAVAAEEGRLKPARRIRGPHGDMGLGICWTVNEARVDLETLPAGQYVACDLWFGAPVDGVARIRTRERVTADSQDLGNVFDDVAGLKVGVVVEIAEGLLAWELLRGGPRPVE